VCPVLFGILTDTLSERRSLSALTQCAGRIDFFSMVLQRLVGHPRFLRSRHLLADGIVNRTTLTSVFQAKSWRNGLTFRAGPFLVTQVLPCPRRFAQFNLPLGGHFSTSVTPRNLSPRPLRFSTAHSTHRLPHRHSGHSLLP